MAKKIVKKDIVKELTEGTMSFIGMLGANLNAGNKKTLRGWLDTEFKRAKNDGKIEGLEEALENKEE